MWGQETALVQEIGYEHDSKAGEVEGIAPFLPCHPVEGMVEIAISASPVKGAGVEAMGRALMVALVAMMVSTPVDMVAADMVLVMEDMQMGQHPRQLRQEDNHRVE